MEIERKYLIHKLPFSLENYPSYQITQGYLSTSPVIRIRQRDHSYFLTCKSKGLLAREEFETSITLEEYQHLSQKIDYNLIHKTRYLIPYKEYTIELDVFKDNLQGLVLAEVEFKSLHSANNFIGPDWFKKDVTSDSSFQNNHLCTLSTNPFSNSI